MYRLIRSVSLIQTLRIMEVMKSPQTVCVESFRGKLRSIVSSLVLVQCEDITVLDVVETLMGFEGLYVLSFAPLFLGEELEFIQLLR